MALFVIGNLALCMINHAVQRLACKLHQLQRFSFFLRAVKAADIEHDVFIFSMSEQSAPQAQYNPTLHSMGQNQVILI